MAHETLSAAIDSQFSAGAQAGSIPAESPLAALGLLSILCQWNPHTMRIDSSDIEWVSMEMLVRGQRSSPELQDLYRSTRNGMPSRWDFWLLVVRASGSRRANIDEAHIRIALQGLNQPESIATAQAAWKSSRLTADPELKKFFQILAMYYLLAGQRHSADTMQLYRACFKETPDELFRRVELITPLDVEDIAIDLESRKKAGTL
jgi:hypothetical protein